MVRRVREVEGPVGRGGEVVRGEEALVVQVPHGAVGRDVLDPGRDRRVGGIDAFAAAKPEKSIPPFCVTTKPPSDAGAAELAPPPTTATVLSAPEVTSTR
jgi:hypothetical protein